MTNNALLGLYEDLVKSYHIKYVLTYRLNQDVLENFFGVLRQQGGMFDHPDRLTFTYRMRKYIVSRNEGIISDHGNIEVDNTPDLKEVTGQAANLFSSINTEDDLVVEEAADPREEELKALEYDALEHVAGYICHRVRNPDIVASAGAAATGWTWVDQLSEGYLTKPAPEFVALLEKLEMIFREMNGEDSLVFRKGFIQYLMDKSSHIDVNAKEKSIFFRSRMYFRMRRLNNEFKSMSSNKRKMNKTVQ